MIDAAANGFSSLESYHLSGLVPAHDFMFESGLAYLNTGSLGATPRVVMNSAIEAWKKIELSPTVNAYGIMEKLMETVREKAAIFLGCKTDELVLTRSTTDGMNTVAQALGLQNGDRVLTTDQEHPGGRSGWDYMARTLGVIVDIVPIPPGENDAHAIVERFSNAIKPKTRIVMFSHLLSSTGLRMPVKELTDLARDHGCLSVIDGAQAIGGIQVDVKSLGCDIYVTSGHKWLLGPTGTGLLYLSETLGTKVDPICLQGGRHAYSDSSGVCNIPGVIGLGAAIDYVVRIGTKRVEGHNLELRNKLYTKLAGMTRLNVVSPPPGPLASPMVTYRLPDVFESRALSNTLLSKHSLSVKTVPKVWMNGHRISTHLYNSEQDIDRLVDALNKEIA